ncbi:hypothetical protein ACJMK2_011251 [Sinanodonta woodiana]|uniref:C1q domain-containing protein n=1 Tax=Sinanodonta woodiana TaxID=1069815 RepID=A0ABD3V4X8_SINWO
MRSSILLLSIALCIVNISLSEIVEPGLYPDVRQWHILLNQMETLQKEHAQYHKQIESLENRLELTDTRLKFTEKRLKSTEKRLELTEKNRVFEIEILKKEMKAAEKRSLKCKLLERRLLIAEKRIGLIETGLHRGILPKMDMAVNEVNLETKYNSSNAKMLWNSKTHELTSKRSRSFISSGRGLIKNRKDNKRQLNGNVNQLIPSGRVAFSTYLSKPLDELGRQHTIIFDQVEYNEGNGYDKTLGVFICPISGAYFFIASILGFPNDNIHTELVVDGSNTAGIDSDSNGGSEYPQGTNMSILRCTVGQRVWVRIMEHFGVRVYSDQYRYTKFVGFMLWSDE